MTKRQLKEIIYEVILSEGSTLDTNIDSMNDNIAGLTKLYKSKGVDISFTVKKDGNKSFTVESEDLLDKAGIFGKNCKELFIYTWGQNATEEDEITLRPKLTWTTKSGKLDEMDYMFKTITYNFKTKKWSAK